MSCPMGKNEPFGQGCCPVTGFTAVSSAELCQGSGYEDCDDGHVKEITIDQHVHPLSPSRQQFQFNPDAILQMQTHKSKYQISYQDRCEALLKAICAAQMNAALHLENPCNLFMELLNSVMNLLECGYGFIAELKYEDDAVEKPFMQCHAISFERITLTEEAKELFQTAASHQFKFNNMNTLFGHVFTSQQAVVSNNPKEDPRSSPTHLPKGHPPLNNFLGLPLKYNNTMVGMIGLANKEGGVSMDDVKFLEPLCSTCSTIIVSWRFYLEREEVKEKLRLANMTLEQRIVQRTEELMQSNNKLQEEIKTRRRIEQELLEQQKLSEKVAIGREKFLQIMSHDCRTPLNCILGISELLLGSQEKLAKEHYDYVTMIKNSGEIMLSLINDFLDVVKLEQQQVNLNQELFSPNEPIEEVIDLVILEAKRKKLEIILDYQPPFPFETILYSDKGRIKQVLLNLLSNAVKFTSYGYIYISVTMSTLENGLIEMKFVVKDTGIGIENENLAKVGQPFVQLNDNNVFKGTGLGLSISRMIANKLKGQLIVESDGIGKGSKFTFTCKLEYKERSNLTTEEQRGISNGENVKHSRIQSFFELEMERKLIRVLILDNNVLISKSIRNMLQSMSHPKNSSIEEVIVCSSKNQMKEELSKQMLFRGEFDELVVIVDVPMITDNCATATLHMIQQELGLPPESIIRLNTETQFDSFVQLVPLINQQEMEADMMLQSDENLLVKPIYKLEEFSKHIYPKLFAHLLSDRPIDIEQTLGSVADGLSILIIEDNLVNSQVLSHILNKLGVKNIVMVPSGEEALVHLKNQFFNIVFLDLFMPGMDGYETSRRINKEYRHHAPNVVVLSACMLEEGEKEELKQNNVKNFLSKPTQLVCLKNLILSLIKK